MQEIDLKDILDGWFTRKERRGEKYGTLGIVVSGSYVVETGDGRVWVTLDDGTAVKAINKAVARKPGIKVIVKPNRDGEMEIRGLQSAQTAASVGNNGSAIANLETPPHQHFIGSGLEDPVESRRFMPGLVHAFSGLSVYIEPFLYDYNGTEARWNGGTIDLTSNRPATTDYWGWVKVGINPATNAAVATTGTEKPLRALLTNIELDAINFDTSGYIPCGGVILQEGQTASPIETDFAEARDFIYYLDPARPPAIGGTTPAAGTFTDVTANRYALTASTTLTIASGVVTATKGYHLIDAESGATDDLDTINGGLTRGDLTIQAASGDTITVKHGTGNIFLNGAADFALSGDKTLRLFYDGTNWADLGAGGGSGGAPTDATYITQTANGSLSAEQALASLSTGIMKVTTTTGVVSSITDSAGVAAVISDETGSGALVFGTSPTLTTPRVVTSVNDTNGNTIIGLTATGSAVNHFTTTNAAASGTPSIGVAGSDTNISISYNAKGTGVHIFEQTQRPTSDNSKDSGAAAQRWASVYSVNHVGDVVATRVKNTSGSTANANHVGYITYTAGSGAEYKTTTTANLNAAWCVVVQGGANNADIYVATSGVVTIELTANCSAGDYLTTSTTAGRAAVNTLMRPEVFAIAQTANAGGAGGTCTARLYCNSQPVGITDANYMWSVLASSATLFVATINGAPSATSVVYNAPSSGNENCIVPGAAGDLLKMRLHNTTRGTYRLITAVNTGTNTVTTVSSTDAWASGDTITIESQTVTSGASYKFMDVDFSQTSVFPALTRSLIMKALFIDTGAANRAGYIHPFETFALSKIFNVLNPATSIYTSVPTPPISVINRAFTVSIDASGTGTGHFWLATYTAFVAAP